MSRRIFSLALVLSLLLALISLTIKTNVQAQSPTATRTSTATMPLPTTTAIPGSNFVGTPLSGSAPLTVQFTHLNGSTLSNCVWNFGDGTSQSFSAVPGMPFGTCPSVTHTYTTPGSFTVSLTVTKSTNGFTGSTVKPQYIQVAGSTPTPVPTNNPLPDLTITKINFAYSNPVCSNNPRVAVTISNLGAAITGSFVVSFNAQTQTVNGLGAGQQVTLPSFNLGSGTNTAVVDSTNLILESNESNNSMTVALPSPTQAPTCTPTSGPSLTATRTPTSTVAAGQPDLVIPTSVGWVWDPNAYDSVNLCYRYTPVLVWNVQVRNDGSADASSFVVNQNYDRQQVISGLPAGQTTTILFPFPGNPLATAALGQPTLAPGYSNFLADFTNQVSESNEANNTGRGPIPTFTRTPSGGPTKVFCATAMPGTPTLTPTRTRTITPTPIIDFITATVSPTPTKSPTPNGSSTCGPVNATITAPFSYNATGTPGTFCWQSTNLGSFINSWNLTSLMINGANFTNVWAPSSSFPVKINGFWYIGYVGTAWGHFEAQP